MTIITGRLALFCMLMILGIANAQCYIKDYQTNRKVLERDGNYVKLHSSGKKVAEFDAGYLKDYQTGRKLFEMDGSYVKLYSSGKKIAEIFMTDQPVTHTTNARCATVFITISTRARLAGPASRSAIQASFSISR